MLKKYFKVLFVVLIVTAFSACGSSSGGEAKVRVIHGSPDAPAVDVLIDEVIAIFGAAFTESAGYLPVDDGTSNVKVNASGTETTVIEADLELDDDVYYTVIASGPLSSISPIVLIDTVQGIPGRSLVRVTHNAPSAPNVDVYVTAPGADISTETPVLTNVPFGVSSEYLELPAGEYQVRVTVTGTTTVAIDSGTITLEPETNYSAIANDDVGGGAPFQLNLYTDSAM